MWRLISQLGYFPSAEERPVVSYNHARFDITDIADKRVEKVTVTLEENHE